MVKTCYLHPAATDFVSLQPISRLFLCGHLPSQKLSFRYVFNCLLSARKEICGQFDICVCVHAFGHCIDNSEKLWTDFDIIFWVIDLWDSDELIVK